MELLIHGEFWVCGKSGHYNRGSFSSNRATGKVFPLEYAIIPNLFRSCSRGEASASHVKSYDFGRIIIISKPSSLPSQRCYSFDEEKVLACFVVFVENLNLQIVGHVELSGRSISPVVK